MRAPRRAFCAIPIRLIFTSSSIFAAKGNDSLTVWRFAIWDRFFIHRIRPYDAGISYLLITPNPDWSFPSDHATAAITVVAAFWFKDQRGMAAKLAVLATLICFSRVYVGVHLYPTLQEVLSLVGFWPSYQPNCIGMRAGMRGASPVFSERIRVN